MRLSVSHRSSPFSSVWHERDHEVEMWHCSSSCIWEHGVVPRSRAERLLDATCVTVDTWQTAESNGQTIGLFRAGVACAIVVMTRPALCATKSTHYRLQQ